jgi:hypothetical protein
LNQLKKKLDFKKGTNEIEIQTNPMNKLKSEYCFDSEIEFKPIKKPKLRRTGNAYRLTIEPTLKKFMPSFEDLDNETTAAD